MIPQPQHTGALGYDAARSPVTSLWQRIRKLTGQPHWWAEVWASFGMTGWACINLSSPANLSQRNFGPLLALAPEHFWETMALCVGLFQIVSLVIDNRWMRTVSGALAAWLSGAVVLNMAFSGFWPPGAVFLYVQNSGLNLTAMVKNIRGNPGGFR